MLKKDIRFLSELGYSLWNESEWAEANVRNTVSAVALSEKDSMLASEKAVRALLTQSEKRGMIVQPRLAQPSLQPGQLNTQDPVEHSSICSPKRESFFWRFIPENGLTKESPA